LGRQIHWSESCDPKSLGELQEIFDCVWREMTSILSYSVLKEHDDQRRKDLAQMIILAHRSGLGIEDIKDALLGELPSA
jgi:hypothetical protein